MKVSIKQLNNPGEWFDIRSLFTGTYGPNTNLTSTDTVYLPIKELEFDTW